MSEERFPLDADGVASGRDATMGEVTTPRVDDDVVVITRASYLHIGNLRPESRGIRS